jgi:hypothetical protein
MNTPFKNVDVDKEIRSFISPTQPTFPPPILYALVDCFLSQGPAWLHSDEAKALRHSLHQMVYGLSYNINGSKEQVRWMKVFGN